MNYSKEESIPLFWAENNGFMKGRDPLGIQNSSVTVYSTLLPGMTNLTLRIRYYSFYCWLLNKWEETAKEENTVEEQYNFIRRGELLLAFIMADQTTDELSVVGSDYVNRALITENTLIELSKGADLPKKKEKKRTIYWKYTSGAMGQYYAGSLISLDLIEIRNKFFCLKDKGKKLGDVFSQSISKEQKSFFIESIGKGDITVGDLIRLEEFRLNNIHQDSAEATLFEELLSPPTDTENKRKETIGLFLSYCNPPVKEYSFPEWIYRNLPENAKADSALFGWAYYYLNEAFHFALETIFQGFLSGLEGRLIQPQKYIQEIKERVLTTFTDKPVYKGDSSLEQILEEIIETDLNKTLHHIEELAKKPANYFIALQVSFELLLIIYKETLSLHSKIKEFEIANNIQFQKGHLTEHFKNYINIHLTYGEFIEKTIKTLMNDHLVTAYRKMGNGDKNLLKFMLEDNVISLVENMPPVHTTPRLRSLRNFMHDLNYLDAEYKPTSKGNQLITALSPAL